MFKTKKAIYIINGIERTIEFKSLFQSIVIYELNEKLEHGIIDAWYIKGEIYNCLIDNDHLKYVLFQKAA